MPQLLVLVDLLLLLLYASFYYDCNSKAKKKSKLYVTIVSLFAIRDHFRQNICKLICEKGPLFNISKNSLCIHTVYILYINIDGNCMDTKLFLMCFNSGPFHKSSHKCFDRSVPLMQIRSHIQNWGNNVIFIIIIIADYKLFNIILGRLI